ncbi:MAG: [Fe-Fe] hydrogenase large subunit C-terminal domain-containing protein [Bacteroidales bacterium]
MNQKHFHHALKFRKEVCIGCSHCMNVCPTQAIRIHGGKANLEDDRCVDCGKCYLACPVGAIIVEQDDFSRIFEFKHRVALIPNILLAQFPDHVSITQICSVLLELGFTDVFEVEHGTGMMEEAMKQYIDGHPEVQPLISTFCPAIVRLVQVQFPSLTDNLVLLKASLDISAAYFQKKLVEQGAEPEDIGIFYITPCAAKIAAIKSPVGDDVSAITGVINMDFIFNKVYTAVKKGFAGKKTCQLPQMTDMPAEAMLWTLTEGEASRMPGRTLAIDEITNVIEFLEKIETEEIRDIDFLELRACDQSCAGGILTSGNRFCAVDRLRKRAATAYTQNHRADLKENNDIEKYRDFLMKDMSTNRILPRSMDKLDEDMTRAMHKMKKVQELMKILPYVDCGLCGSPTCNALAEDIAQGKAEITRCIYVQKKLEKEGALTPDASMEIMKQIWGADKFEDQPNQ